MFPSLCNIEIQHSFWVHEQQCVRNNVLSFARALTLETSAFESLYGGQFTSSTLLIKPNYLVTSEMFYAHILYMKSGSSHARGFRCTYCTFSGPKSYSGLSKNGHQDSSADYLLAFLKGIYYFVFTCNYFSAMNCNKQI